MEEEEQTYCELRAVETEQSLLSRPDGSARFSQGDTCVLAAVYGPAEVKSNKEKIDRATVEVVFKPKIGIPGPKEKLIEKIVCNTCEAILLVSSYPKSSITIILQIYQDFGALLSCSINAACMALIDSGLSMNFLVSSVTAAILKEEEKIVLDPNSKQEKEASAVLVFAFDSQKRNVLATHSTGRFTSEKFQICLNMCQEASTKIIEFYKQSVERKYSKFH